MGNADACDFQANFGRGLPLTQALDPTTTGAENVEPLIPF